MVADGFTITRAIQSRSWPAASANLEYAAVWGTRQQLPRDLPRFSDELPVRRISPLLEPEGRVVGMPVRLKENAGVSFEGMKPYGQGFVLDPGDADEWIAADAANAEVLFPYLNGEDVNSRPDASASRCVIDFYNRTVEEAARYRAPFSRVLEIVRPERESKAAAVRNVPWWLFFRPRPALRKAIASLEYVLVITIVSKSVMPVRVPTGQVFSHALGVFASDGYGVQAVLSSNLHQIWAITYGSTLETRVRYTPSDVFETFPLPEPTDRLEQIGRILDEERREIMLRRNLGLTKLYNLVNDSELADSADQDAARLRAIHVELDYIVLDSYGWSDIALGHGIHTFRQMRRWTMSPAARVEILDRLLEENHRRAERDEVRKGAPARI